MITPGRRRTDFASAWPTSNVHICLSDEHPLDHLVDILAVKQPHQGSFKTDTQPSRLRRRIIG